MDKNIQHSNVHYIFFTAKCAGVRFLEVSLPQISIGMYWTMAEFCIDIVIL